jgi:hypothetical protein
MDHIVYELACDACDNEYEVSIAEKIDDTVAKPIYCPFCGTDVDLTDIEEEDYTDELDDIEEFNFDDEWKP